MFRAGEEGRFWYAVLGGQLEVRYHTQADGDGKVIFCLNFSIKPGLVHKRCPLGFVNI